MNITCLDPTRLIRFKQKVDRLLNELSEESYELIKDEEALDDVIGSIEGLREDVSHLQRKDVEKSE